MTRRILLIAHYSIGIASAVAEVLASADPGDTIDVVTEEEWDNELLYGAGIGEPLGILNHRTIKYDAKPIDMAPDFRDYIALPRPGKDPNRHRPRDLYHSRKQGKKRR